MIIHNIRFYIETIDDSDGRFQHVLPVACLVHGLSCVEIDNQGRGRISFDGETGNEFQGIARDFHMNGDRIDHHFCRRDDQSQLRKCSRRKMCLAKDGGHSALEFQQIERLFHQFDLFPVLAGIIFSGRLTCRQ